MTQRLPSHGDLVAKIPRDRLLDFLGKAPGDERDEHLLESLEDARKELGAVRASFDLDEALYQIFKLLAQPETGTLPWQAWKDRALATRGKQATWDTDEALLRLWREVESGSAIDHHWSATAHRNWLFHRLLERYDLRRARRVLGGGALVAHAHLILLLVMTMLFASAMAKPDWFTPTGPLWRPLLYAVVVIYAAVAGLLWLGLRRSKDDAKSDDLEALAYGLQSLLPRIGGASAAGLVILISSEELLRVVCRTRPIWGVVVALGVFCYLLLEMERRVQPLPRLRRMLSHGVDISSTALAHSLGLTLLALNPLARTLHGAGPADPISAGQALMVVVFIYGIGVLFNVIWAEQPITEPL